MNATGLGLGIESSKVALNPEIRGLHPSLAAAVGSWYSLVSAAASSTGVKYLSQHPDNHQVLSSLCWVLGAASAATVMGRASRSKPMAVAVLSVIPVAVLPFVLVVLYVRADQQTSSWNVFPELTTSVVAPLAILLVGTLIATVAGSFLISENLSDILKSLTSIHLWWLWLPVGICPPGESPL